MNVTKLFWLFELCNEITLYCVVLSYILFETAYVLCFMTIACIDIRWYVLWNESWTFVTFRTTAAYDIGLVFE